MPRAFSDRLFLHLFEAFPPTRDYARADFDRAPMPSLMAHFLTQTLQRRFDLEVEQLRAVRSNWFDYDHPEVREAHKVLIVALLQHAQIPREEWERTLRQAVERVTAYLIRPSQTLVDFVFNVEEGPLPAHVVYRRIGYFAAYPYLRAAVEAYFERKGKPEITRARFAELLTRVDRQMAEDYDVEAWLALMEPLLLLMGDLTPGRTEAPVSVLRAFFEDKGAQEIVARLDAAARRNVRALDEAGLRELLESALAPARPVAAPAPPPPVAAPAPSFVRHEPPVAAPERPVVLEPLPPPEPAPSREAAPPVEASAAPEPEPPVEPAPSPEDEAVPLWKKFMHAPGAEAPEAAPPPADPEAMPLWMRFRSNAEPGTADLPALEHAILGEQASLNRERFVKYLFSGSEEAYERVLRRLYTAPTWTQASQIIAQDVFKAHRVNIYSPPAIAFTNAVEARYRQDERL
ncbi:hypothetical protein [Rhodocaloribacter sp.]